MVATEEAASQSSEASDHRSSKWVQIAAAPKKTGRFYLIFWIREYDFGRLFQKFRPKTIEPKHIR